VGIRVQGVYDGVRDVSEALNVESERGKLLSLDFHSPIAYLANCTPESPQPRESGLDSTQGSVVQLCPAGSSCRRIFAHVNLATGVRR